ncbi:hypothetical protein GpartN1_g2705.t1 [Galdieria partita]|uniref:Uncharacterized protein n=1 Tax=Galdieria partita TaxID=83374 RepID=A0A9C7UPH0_9RHOD|nr:hypothetical protein GpartN1_g2705.t1 [Galdieria partita]
MLQLLNFCLYLYDNYGRACFGVRGHASNRRKSGDTKKKRTRRGWEQLVKSLLQRQERPKKPDLSIEDCISEDTCDDEKDIVDNEIWNEDRLQRLSFSSDLATPRRQRPLSNEEFEDILSQFPVEELSFSKWTILEE